MDIKDSRLKKLRSNDLVIVLLVEFALVGTTSLAFSSAARADDAEVLAPTEQQTKPIQACDPSLSSTLKSGERLIHINGMLCQFCVKGIERQLTQLTGVIKVKISMDQNAVTVELSPSQTVTDEELGQAVERAGFEIKDIHHPNDQPHIEERTKPVAKDEAEPVAKDEAEP